MLVSVSRLVSGDECQIKSVTNVVTLLLPHPSQHYLSYLHKRGDCHNGAAFTLSEVFTHLQLSNEEHDLK